MSKVTSKLQVTIPKVLADDYAIQPGSEVFFEPAGDVIRVRIGREVEAAEAESPEWALAIFDAATERQSHRQRNRAHAEGPPTTRGWTREELYADRVAR